MHSTHQNDSHVRVVSLANLRAMCARVSGMSHRFTAEITKNRCTLEYSNPDEYGSPCPITWRLPLLRSRDLDNPDVILHVSSEAGGRGPDDRESAFQGIEAEIFSGPRLWRDPTSGKWRTAHETAKASAEAGRTETLHLMPRGPFRAKAAADGSAFSHAVTDGRGAVVAFVPGWTVHPDNGTCQVSQRLAERIAWALHREAEADGTPTAPQEDAIAEQRAAMARAEAARAARASNASRGA